jgi:hypothetical protein
MQVFVVREKIDNWTEGQLTVFKDEKLASLYVRLRDSYQTWASTFRFPMEKVEINQAMFQTAIDLNSTKTGTTIYLYNGPEDDVIFLTESEMEAKIREVEERSQKLYKESTSYRTRRYKLMYIQTKKDAIQYAKLINDLDQWWITLRLTHRYGKPNCLISDAAMKQIGYDSDSETIQEFINKMRPIADTMWNMTKKQLAKMNSERIELRFVGSYDSDDE